MKLDALHSALMSLPPAGASGFEGLMRDILVEVTGERFGVIKSGEQPGADVLSTPGDTQLTIAAEGTLVKLVKDAASEQEAQAIVEMSIEPYQGADVAVAVLRSAATFALVDESVPDAGKHALLRVWLAAQNFRNEDFQAFWRLIGCNIPVVLACVQNIWFGDNLNGRADEVIVKAFANASRWENVGAAMQLATKRWLSRTWLDPLEGAILGQIVQDDPARERMARTQQRFDKWKGSGLGKILGVDVQLVEPANQSWGVARTIELLSWQKRAPFVPALVTWAISQAIMGPPYRDERVGWLLRWNEEDPAQAEEAVLSACSLLLSHDHEVTRTATRLLLEALATPAAMAFLSDHIPSPVPRPAPLIDDGVSCEGVTIKWRVDEILQWPRCQDAPLDAAIGLNKFAWDHEAELGGSAIERLKQLADSITDAQLWGILKSPEDDAGLANGRLPLARWAPEDKRRLWWLDYLLNVSLKHLPAAWPPLHDLWTNACRQAPS